MSSGSQFLLVTSAQRNGVSIQAVMTLLAPFADGEITICSSGAAVVVVTGDQTRRPETVIQLGDIVGVGCVRLDNREDIERLLAERGHKSRSTTDLELAVEAVENLPRVSVRELLGDFGFAVYNSAKRTGFAVRDALGTCQLFYTVRGDLFLVSSSATMLGRDNYANYDEAFFARLLMGDLSSTPATAFADVTRLLDGHWLQWEGGTVLLRSYWSPRDATSLTLSFECACREFAQRFATAVQTRVPSNRHTWAELSGGTDSSSIVAMAQHLAQAGQSRTLEGAVTLEDSFSTGDERGYVREIIGSTGLRHERIVDDWPWRDDGEVPPLSDEPLPDYPFFARDRRLYRTVRRAGGDVLLSGYGADHFLSGNLYYLTDLVSSGEFAAASRAIIAVARAYHSSFWKDAWEYSIAPFLPWRLRASLLPAQFRPPTWLERLFVRRHGLTHLWSEADTSIGQGADHFTAVLYRGLRGIPQHSGRGCLAEGIEIRYPFLSRPLVELVLGLPPRYVIDAGWTKRILRGAMVGILPDRVRLRTTKGGPNARFLWALQKENRRLTELLRNPILGDLRWICPQELRRSVDAARCGKVTNLAYLFSTLALETWLSVRAGRWQSHPSALPQLDEHAA